MKKVVLVGRDKAPSILLDPVADQLYKDGHEIRVFTGHGKPIEVSAERLAEEMMDANLIITGNSSSKELARFELIASEFAFLNTIPLVWYSDLFGNALQAHFREIVERYKKEPAAVAVMDDYEKRMIENIYTHSEAVITGNYGMEDMAFPEWDRKHARSVLGVKYDERMILVVAGKDKEMNTAIFEGAVKALYDVHISFGLKMKVFLSMHPGDENPPDIYRHLERNDPEFSVTLMTRAEYDRGFTTSRIFIGADGMISTGSTTEFGSFYWNIPVITVFTPYSLERFSHATNGRTKWGPAELDASYALYNFKNDYSGEYELAHAVNSYIFGLGRNGEDLRNKMIENQKKFYPRPEERIVVRKMMESLKRFL